MNMMIWVLFRTGLGGWRQEVVATLSVMLIICIAYGIAKIRKLKLFSVRLKDDLDSEQAGIKQLSAENEWLVREIHHRVKNNLQIMMSLLNMQLSYLTSDEAQLAIRNNCHRLFAISLVYQKLYKTESLSSVDVSIYLQELAQYLQYEFNGAERIVLQIYADPLYLDVQTAIPLGLIMNEALSNSFRHGFPDGAKGTVSIYLRSEDEFQYLLQISDDGTGFPKDYHSAQLPSLGQSLMHGLSGQLRGRLSIQDDHGVSVILLFPRNSDAGDAET